MAMRHTLVLAAAALAGAACSPQRFFLKTAWVDGVNYVASPDVTGHDFTQVGDGVYAFHSGFYSNIVIKTGEGLVVTDPMGVENAKLLRSELDRAFPGWPVHTMIYSHYHLDHVTGGAALGAKNILAHPSCAKRWQDIGAKDIAMPTRYLPDGDQTLVIGGVEIQLLLFEHAHSEALYAFYLPQQKVLHSVDMGFVRMIPPLGIPESYMPSVLAALDRMAGLDFDVWVPSHYVKGNKADLIEYIGMTRDLRKLVSDALTKHHGVPTDKGQMGEMFAEVYDPFEAKYGKWHGFDQQALIAMYAESFRQVLGY
jgi:glyoxylase-like metal-dependent hydrolase (beta-lactamase superfamily II)